MSKKKVKHNKWAKNKRVIPGFENYAITKDGGVWSKPRKDLQGAKRKGKWLKPSIDNGGYLYVVLYKNGNRHFRKIHHLVLETFICLCPKRMECRHLDGNPSNNNLKNLCWGTKKDNMKDRKKHGTEKIPNNSGEKNGQAKLSEKDVKLIFNSYWNEEYTQNELAEYFGVTRHCVGNIVRKRAWKHLW